MTLHYTILFFKLFLIPKMAASSFSSLQFLLIFLIFSIVFIVSESDRTLFKPNNLMLPVHKDGATNLHVAKISTGTPQTPLYFAVDLNGRFLWAKCEKHVSSTYHAPNCHSTHCSEANSQYCFKCSSSNARPGCHNNTCGLMSTNPVTHQSAMGELAEDTLLIQSTTGSNPGPMVRIPLFLLVCAPSRLLQHGLPIYVQGIAGLGHAPIALPTQFASDFGFAPNFAMCLSSSSTHPGVILFGPGPFYTLPRIEISRAVSYTPLTVSRQGEYYVDVSSIMIQKERVPIDPALLKMTKRGTGGTMISTTKPYTVLQRSIHRAFTNFFIRRMLPLKQVRPVAPFSACYRSDSFQSTKAGPSAPEIALVFSNGSAAWNILGANSLVEARPGVLCLGFVDGGLRLEGGASIIIGAHQLEDNFVQFDLARSRLGFSSSLLSQRTSCANFNFTQTP